LPGLGRRRRFDGTLALLAEAGAARRSWRCSPKLALLAEEAAAAMRHVQFRIVLLSHSDARAASEEL
jgi:hypothetical protein